MSHYRRWSRVLPLTQVAGLFPTIRYLERNGVPVEKFLRQAHIPLQLLESPEASLPSLLVYQFVDLVCRSEDIPDLGLWVGMQTSLNELGVYGHILQDSLTVGEYLRKGIRLISMSSTSQRFQLTVHGNELRFNLFTSGGAALGKHQAELYAMVITINQLHAVAGSAWFPSEIGLAYKNPRELPDIDFLNRARIHNGGGESFFTLPKSILAKPFKRRAFDQSATSYAEPARALPEDFVGAMEHMIEMFLTHATYPDINLAAEAAGTSRRNLQRNLAERNLSYASMVNNIRTRIAARQLETTDKAIKEIAFSLGYSDAANFTRAFRRRTGVSPKDYRQAAIG